MPDAIPDTTELRAALEDIGGRRTVHAAQLRQTSEELRELVPRAHAAGLTPTEIHRLAGISRKTVYELLSDRICYTPEHRTRGANRQQHRRN